MKRPSNWQLVEMYEGNFIFQDSQEEFQVSVDRMGRMTPPYHVHFSHLKDKLLRIGVSESTYSANAYDENAAMGKAYEMMEFINRNRR
ncbi:hypothetical protein [Salinimicrobium sediminilitoris]|uniref:hypothetical protein n=1 Tax=Salinimicrobium sediminilitoris TaxID=2876715 RepID=UPI001E2B0C74|nr:hypothetical protein [Salinimicrobium sediminilitoris]MCC8361013.1 hypothetical protein [Salinimicrobium sediminilitoris]